MHSRVGVTPEGEGSKTLGRTVAKNLAVLLLVVGSWLALDTGYLSPDRLTRSQEERIERARKTKGGQVVYRSDFSREGPGGAKGTGGYWGYYNGASSETVKGDATGITVSYDGTPWIGAALHFTGFEPDTLYRLKLERTVEGEAAAIIVRNRQSDIVNAEVPVGTGPIAVEFVSPRGRWDRVEVAFIPENREKPKGTLRITFVSIERLRE